MENKGKLLIVAALLTALLVPPLFFSGCTGGSKDKENIIRIGAQNYAEVIIMAYAAEALIQDQTDYNVEVIPRLGSALVLEQALKAQEVDIASLFFTGGSTGILHPDFADDVDLSEPKWRDPDYIWNYLMERVEEVQGRIWLPPLGWNNNFAVTVTREFAEEHGLEKVSDLQGLSQDLIIGMDDSYLERELDGYYPLLELYDLEPFKKTVAMQISLLYQALDNGQVDVGIAYSSDARIHAFDLVWLDDDRSLYPPAHAAYGINLELLERAPEIPEVLGQLSGKVDIETIRRLNYEVDINKRDEREVAVEFLKEIGLLGE